jgi:hypothetical protein
MAQLAIAQASPRLLPPAAAVGAAGGTPAPSPSLTAWASAERADAPPQQQQQQQLVSHTPSRMSVGTDADDGTSGTPTSPWLPSTPASPPLSDADAEGWLHRTPDRAS